MEQTLDIERPRRVDIGAIERELREIRREANAGSDHPTVRASLLSLVTVVSPDQRDHVSDLAAEVALRHPSRTILLVIDPDAEADEVTAEVSARCYLSFGMRKQVCSEQIIIVAKGKSAGELHALVAPLVTSDLPAVLWWRAPRWPEARSFKLLADLCTRVVFDSTIFVNSLNNITLLHGLIHDLGPRAVADLAWARLTPWRAALAGLFDVPAYRADLDHLNRIVIEHSSGGPDNRGTTQSPVPASAPAPGPLLLVGWLASRLGWKPECATRVDKVWNIDFTDGSGEAQLTLSLRGGGAPGHGEQTGRGAMATSIAHIELWRDEITGRKASSFSIRFSQGCLETTATIEGEQRGGRVVPSEDRGEVDLLGEELDMLGRDVIYESALSMTAELAELMSRA